MVCSGNWLPEQLSTDHVDLRLTGSPSCAHFWITACQQSYAEWEYEFCFPSFLILFWECIYAVSLSLLCSLVLLFFKYVPVLLQPVDALTGHTAPDVSCAALQPGPTPVAFHEETPAGPGPVWPCQHLCRITAPHLKDNRHFCFQSVLLPVICLL